MFSDDEQGEALAGELRASGATVSYMHADMTREGDVDALVRFAVDERHRIDVAVNVVGNVGGGDRPGILLHEETLDQWNGTIAQSLTSMFLSMKYELAAMVEAGGGSIVNVASVVGCGSSPEVRRRTPRQRLGSSICHGAQRSPTPVEVSE